MNDRQNEGVVTVTPALLRELAPPSPEGAAHKGMRGRVLVIGGTAETPGAAILSGIAALRAGAGILQVATAKSVARSVAVALPESRVVGLEEATSGELSPSCVQRVAQLVESADAVLVGPGLSDGDGLTAIVRAVFEKVSDSAVVVDAGALGVVTPRMVDGHREHTVLIPNTKEAADLLGAPVDDVGRDPVSSLRRLVEDFGCAIALRGGSTYVGDPSSPVFHNESGSPGLGTSGSGDTVAGFIAGLLARGSAPLAAAMWGVEVHGRAGQRLAQRVGRLGFLARELLEEMTPVAEELAD